MPGSPTPGWRTTTRRGASWWSRSATLRRVSSSSPLPWAATPTTDPHYAGCYVLGAIQEGNQPLNVTVNLGSVLRRIDRTERGRVDPDLRVTVVGVNGRTGEGIPISFKRATLFLDD